MVPQCLCRPGGYFFHKARDGTKGFHLHGVLEGALVCRGRMEVGGVEVRGKDGVVKKKKRGRLRKTLRRRHQVGEDRPFRGNARRPKPYHHLIGTYFTL